MTGMFVGLHAVLAQRTNTPELAIGMDEGAAFMGAAQNVMRHYSVEATQKTLDWISFAGVAGGMYLTRAVAITNRLAVEKRERADFGRPEAGQVLRFRRPGREPPAPEPVAPDLADFTPGLGGFAGELEPA